MTCFLLGVSIGAIGTALGLMVLGVIVGISDR